jgi:tubulin polyglutamylase TTLL9
MQVGRAQGKGIFIVSRIAQVEAWLRERAASDRAAAALAASPSAAAALAAGGPPPEAPEAFVVQRYIDAPLLVGGRKFDLRLYAVVTSYAPLRVWLYREGFARFTARRYSSDAASLANPFVHLTNHAVQKQDAEYDASTCDLKWPVGAMRAYIAARHGEARAAAAMGDINSVITGALRAVAPSMINDRHCCEMYGYDVMLDANLKPWLIEVNASPSLSSDTVADAELKTRLVDDYMSVLDMEGAWGAAGPPSPCGGFDLIWDKEAPVACAEFPDCPSMMGALNERSGPAFRRIKAATAAAAAAREDGFGMRAAQRAAERTR